jgi:hypothetical protein
MKPLIKGQTFPKETPDRVLAIGTVESDALFSVQIEGRYSTNRQFQKAQGHLALLENPR